jgi:glycosyltransferase involved in cell wall biosynthesis
MTSTQWLKDVCVNPTEGWDYTAWKSSYVTVVGWYHYGHEVFNCPPQNRTFGSADSGFRVGTLIHPHPLKGTDVAIGVIDGLKRKWEGQFHAVGFGEGKAKLPSYIQHIRGETRKNMAHVMKQVDVWLGASYSEGLGRMALEAMSAGCVVVTSDTGAEFLKDKENCLLYEPGDAQAAAELVDLVVQNKDDMKTLILAGHKTAEEAADPTQFRKNVGKVIEKVLK